MHTAPLLLGAGTPDSDFTPFNNLAQLSVLDLLGWTVRQQIRVEATTATVPVSTHEGMLPKGRCRLLWVVCLGSLGAVPQPFQRVVDGFP